MTNYLLNICWSCDYFWWTYLWKISNWAVA